MFAPGSRESGSLGYVSFLLLNPHLPEKPACHLLLSEPSPRGGVRVMRLSRTAMPRLSRRDQNTLTAPGLIQKPDSAALSNKGLPGLRAMPLCVHRVGNGRHVFPCLFQFCGSQ